MTKVQGLEIRKKCVVLYECYKSAHSIDPYNAELFLFKSWRPKVLFHFKSL